MASQLSVLNDPPRILDGPQLLHKLIRWSKHGDALAIDFTSNGQRGMYTYRQVQSQVESLASRIQDALPACILRDGQPRRQHVVPVLLPQSPGLYVSQLAVLASGGAFCPINLDAPKERIKFVVGDVAADLIITTSDFRNSVSWENGPTAIFIDEFPTLEDKKTATGGRSREASPHDLAYVMYTSGSSGTPKGVAVSHLAVSQSLLAHERHVPKFDRFLQFAAPSFDVSVFETFFPLVRGSTLVGCNRSQLLNDLPAMLNTLEIDAAELTPTVVGSLLQKRSNAPGLKLLLTIGEMLTWPIVEEFGGSETQPNMLYGMYGPTEAAIHCTIYPKMATNTKPGNIGRPFDTVSTFIAAAGNPMEDAGKLEFLPVGELGELVLGGPQLAQGYLNREQQNKAAFVQFDGMFYYRTGDKARQLEDGTIEILGRMSAGQVKLRGQRVELGEIEQAVYKHPGVKTVAALVLGSVLVAFALIGDESVQPEQVLETCSKWLPKFMMPSEIVLLQKFSYLPSGKVDKRKLQSDYEQNQGQGRAEEVESISQTARTVKDALAEILGPFSSTMRLPAAGLDSLVAIRVGSKLRSLGFNVTTVSVLQSDTLGSLVRLCENSTPASIQSPRTTRNLVPKSVTTILNGHAQDVEFTMPCTPLQSAMLSETAKNEKAYRNWVELDLLTDVEHVTSCLCTLASANSILRTGFTESHDSEGYVQIVWRSLDTSQIEEVQQLNYEFDRSKDLSLHHPLRIQILRCGSGTKLLVHLHHALYDAWSLELILDDLDELIAGRPLPERPGFCNIVDGYTDGILNINNWSLKDYWKDHLAHLDNAHLPSFHTGRTPSPALAVTRLATSILTADVEAVSRTMSASPQSIFQAAYAVILGSYVGSSDVCFGSVFSGRTLPIAGIEDISGPCLATLPVRIDTSVSNSLQDLVRDINLTNRKHLENSTLPLRDIKSSSGIDPRQPLFDTLLIWQQTLHSYDHARKNVLLVETMDNLEISLTLEIIPGTGNIELKANYQQSVFPESQINTLLQQVEQLARMIIEDDSIPLNNVFGHLPAGISSIENENPDTDLRGWALSSPVEDIAARYPDRQAISFATSINEEIAEVQNISYSKLNSRSNRIGSCLLQEHVLPDELVCILLEKCVDLYTSILATAKIGAGYLPLTPDVPSERLHQILHAAKTKIIIAQSSSRPLLKSLQMIKIIYIDEIDFSRFSAANISPRSSPEDIAYCVFTSGSTGVPKGVLVTQGNLLSNLDVLQNLYPTNERSRFLQSCSQAFDVSVFEIFFAWRVGGCICSATRDVLFHDIEKTIRTLNITHLSLTPTVASLIDPKNVPQVEFLVTAGEAVTQKVFNVWAGQGLWQGYGPSETTNICTVSPRVTQDDAINNIGTPFQNTSAFVLAPGLDFIPVPRGGIGEFCFGGSQVFRGYMDQKQEAGKIIEHPLYGRLYRSGDFGRLLPDGSLAFTGRKDDQVKIRGQRVELGEINNILLRSIEVEDCVTMVIDGENDSSQRLVCFWSPGPENSSALECLSPDPSIISKLYKSIDSALPAYMIPSALIPISFLPSTPQGKIDKCTLVALFRALSVAYLNQTAQATNSLSDHDWSDLEKQIVQAVAKSINVHYENVGPNTSFFNLGIDSISAISVARTLRQTINRQVAISDILKYPSIVRLAERISNLTEQIHGEQPMQPHTIADFSFEKSFQQSIIKRFVEAGKSVQSILPCTPLQEAMLSAAEASLENLYMNHVTFKVNGDVHKLQGCWREMVQRHEILRTCFVATDMLRYPFAQVVLDSHDIASHSSDSSTLAATTKELKPPYTLTVVDSQHGVEMTIAMHHALYDGVALTVLYDEVERLYHGERLDVKLSFAPFLQSMVSVDMVEADKFWGNILQDCKHARFKTKFQPVSGQSHTRVQYSTHKSTLSWIEGNIKKHSTSLLAACHAVWSSVMSEHFLQTDIVFGNVVSGRTLPIESIDRLVAPCFNTIPVRLQNIQNITYLEAFRTLQHLNASSLPFQLSPLRRIQSKFSLDGARLFDTLFILQQPPRELDASIWKIEHEEGAMDFPLVFEVVPRPREDSLEIVLHSYTSVIDEEAARGILSMFEQRLEDALSGPRRQLLSTSVKEKIIAAESRREKTESLNDRITSKEMTAKELALRHLVSIFTNVKSERITRDVSIFRLGLDSISAVQVATRLRKQGYHVMASDILEHPTIAKLSGYLSQGTSAKSTSSSDFDFQTYDKQHRASLCSRNGIRSDDVQAVRPCTSVQQGMLAQTLHSGGQEYMNSMWLETPSDTSIEKLKEAWTTTWQNHEMLRTVFAATEDPKYPFAMITYSEEAFHLPWYVDGNAPRYTSITEAPLGCPWSLEFKEVDGKNQIKFTAHHALYDAQSIHMILSDVAKSYSGGSISSPSVGVLLGAILRSSQEDIDGKQEFWQRDENRIVVNRFPDLTPLRVAEEISDVHEITSRKSLAHFQRLCRENGVTMQAASQAAWSRILAAYIGETSTTFGITLSGRAAHEDADKIAFPSIVTLPVICEVAGTNAELLSRTMNSNAMLHRHQFTPLISIQKWAGYPEGKIFDTLLAFQKVPDDTDEVVLPWETIKEEAHVDYAISLEVQPSQAGEVIFRLTFRRDLIPAEHAKIILKQYDALLLDTLENPESRCDILPLAGNELLSITPADKVELDTPVSLLHEFVERGAELWPDKVALEFATSLEPGNFKSNSWSYSQLNAESNKIANLLEDYKIMPGQIIAICFDKCAEASFTIIGILKAGCAFVALDPNAPADRLKFILKDSNAKMVLSTGKPGENLKALPIDISIILLDSINTLSIYASENPKLARKLLPEDVAYCLYTSGTTGTPKGCLITHENTVQFMLAFSKHFAGHWDSGSKYLQFASFHFDVSVMEQFWSWSIGICVASAPRDLIFEDIAAAINQLNITHIDLTPSLARILHPDDVPSLLRGGFVTGGEQLRQEILDVWGEHDVIYNAYGPTEATIGCTLYPRVPQNGKPSNIGPAYINVGSFVLKPGTEIPVLRGGVGELCVSGKLVGKGYLNRDGLTAEKFPTLKAFGERVYRTGDLVRILHDGSFIFLGRADDQVKLRGQRLELSEINEVIKKGAEGVEEVVTLVLKHSAQQKEQLVTFFVAKEADSIDTMREACKARLPGYMVPTHFVPIEKLPLNANNKADSKQLATIYDKLTVEDLRKLSRSSDENKAWTDKENTVVGMIANAMQVEPTTLTRTSNIFELGLDSISIIGFSRALQNAGLGSAKLSVVKSNPSIGALVRALSDAVVPDRCREHSYISAKQSIAAFGQRHLVGVCKELGIGSHDVESVVPCTPVQEGMIYKFLESEQTLYFNKFEFQLDNNVDEIKLMEAWAEVISQVEILRTAFVATDDGFAQVVLKQYDKSRSRDLDYETIDKYTALQTPYTLNLSGRLTLHIFHGLYDGNSLAMLLRRVVEAYQGNTPFRHGPSFVSALPYGPLAKVSGDEEFWASHLKTWSCRPIPKHNKCPSKDIVVRGVVDDIHNFDSLRKQLSVTPQALMQAVWLSVLQSLISSNLTIGIVTSGRAIDFEDADQVIGPLFNTVPFHTRLTPGIKMADLIKRCHGFNMRMQDFQHSALKDIQKWSPAKMGQALFESLFVFQRPEGDEDYASGVWREIDGEQVADYPLAFEATLDSDGKKLSVTIVGQGAYITEVGALDLLSQVRKLLQKTLASYGDNIIPVAEAYTNGDETWNDSNGSAHPSLSGDPDRAFVWTEIAQSIKQEIALLARVEEDVILETSSVFELGLDSIDVIKLSSRLKKQGIQIPVSAIIKSQTIAKMVLNITAKLDLKKPSSGKSLENMGEDLTTCLKSAGKLPDDAEAVLPATPLQQSMVNEMLKSEYRRYFNVDAFKMADSVDFDVMMLALAAVRRQSPILRTSFVEVTDPKIPVSYAQIVHKVKTGDGSPGTILHKGQTFDSFMEHFKEASAAFAASEGLLQVRRVKSQDSRDNYLVVAIAHALYDGTSLRSFHEDIRRAYRDALESRPYDYQRPNYRPYLEQVFQSTTEEAKQFWKTTLSNLPSATFPLKNRAEVADYSKVTRLERRSRIGLPAIEKICKSSRITLQTLGQTCWALVLSHLMSQLDVVFGSVLSCRDTEEANEVMFPLMNTVAVRAVLHGTLVEMLRYMQEMSDTTRQYQHFPLGTAQAYALASRQDHGSSKDTTLFDTLFIYQGRRAVETEERLYESVYGASEVEFPVCVEMEVVETAEEKHLVWTTACKASARNSIETERLIDALESVLEHIIANPKDQTMISDVEGVSICGLSKFKLQETSAKEIPPNSTNGTAHYSKWSETEGLIRRALHEISGVAEDSIRKDSTIFHLGLDSILVLKLPALLKTHGIKLSVSDILRDQTVMAMAHTAQGSIAADASVNVNAILKQSAANLNIDGLGLDAKEIEYMMPATAGQVYMIRNWRVSGGALFFHNFTYTLTDQLDKAALERAWNTLLVRHPILRTGFVETPSTVWQVVYQKPNNYPIYDHGKLSEISPDVDHQSPPLNIFVDELESTIRLHIHHALYDGISLPIIIDELQSLYQGRELPSSAPGAGFRSFVAQSISTPSPAEKWRSYLQESTLYSDAPVVKPKQRVEVFHPNIPAPSLKTQAQEIGVSIDALLLSSVAKGFAQHLLLNCLDKTRISQVTFGIYLSNRAPFGEDLSDLPAPTLNILPICVKSPLERGSTELARDIQKDVRMVGSKEMVSASLEEICEWTGVTVDVFVNILKTPASPPGPTISGEEKSWTSNTKFAQTAESVDLHVNDTIRILDGGIEAYLPSVDIEMRYHKGSIDIGVFASRDLMGIEDAKDMITGFVKGLG